MNVHLRQERQVCRPNTVTAAGFHDWSLPEKLEAAVTFLEEGARLDLVSKLADLTLQPAVLVSLSGLRGCDVVWLHLPDGRAGCFTVSGMSRARRFTLTCAETKEVVELSAEEIYDLQTSASLCLQDSARLYDEADRPGAAGDYSSEQRP